MTTTSARGPDGTKRILVFNKSVILVDSHDVVSFAIEDPALMLTLNYTLSDEGDPLAAEVKLSEDGATLDNTLHKWESPLGVENLSPMVFTRRRDQKRIWIKHRVYATPEHKFRTLHVSIWVEE
jgi:hypothetical protein